MAQNSHAGGDRRDERCYEELRTAVADIDPVPERVHEAARAIFTWRSVDDELARLVHDSLEEQNDLVGVRGTSTMRLVTFESEGSIVDIQILIEVDRRTIIGEVVPGAAAEVQIRRTNTITTVLTDQRGRFRAADLQAGPISLRCRFLGTDAAQPLVTSWFPL